jgi:hypothetical protein
MTEEERAKLEAFCAVVVLHQQTLENLTQALSHLTASVRALTATVEARNE